MRRETCKETEKRERGKAVLTIILSAGLILGLAVYGLLLPDQEVSRWERRRLASAPELNGDTLLSGSFMSGMETYLQDQFPFRDGLRSLKALVSCGLFRQKDSHGVYTAGGYAAKLDYPLDMDSVDYAAERFACVYGQYLKESGSEIYVSVIPDKNQFLAEKNGYPCLDFGALTERLTEQMPYASYIEIAPLLELEDYYRTDIHWRQEKITGVAAALNRAMGFGDGPEEVWQERRLPAPFYGVYRGQSALPMPAESMVWLETEGMENWTVYDYETDSEIPVYDLEAAEGMDPYALFLSGSKSLLRIENPAAPEENRLILFRDSFGSSIAPLLAEHVRELILADIRYISPALLGELISFEGRDVLFLYSESVLNNSEMLK